MASYSVVGGAVRNGVLHSSGKLILFADADGATKFSDIDRLEKGLLRMSGGPPVDESFPAVVVGSRFVKIPLFFSNLLWALHV